MIKASPSTCAHIWLGSSTVYFYVITVGIFWVFIFATKFSFRLKILEFKNSLKCSIINIDCCKRILEQINNGCLAFFQNGHTAKYFQLQFTNSIPYLGKLFLLYHIVVLESNLSSKFITLPTKSYGFWNI